MGKVYIFNTWSEELISFSINGAISDIGGGKIPGSSTAESSKYTPGSNDTFYPRAIYPVQGQAQFFVGDENTISFFTASDGRHSVTLTIPGADSPEKIPLAEDLIIYITQNLLLVMTQYGFVTGSFTINKSQ